MFGFSKSTGQSKTLGENSWRFYNSSGELLAVIAGAVTTFLGLTDTPSSYTGQASKFTRVNSGETALEFASIVGSGWDVLTNGDTADPEPIFALGEMVMVETCGGSAC